MDKISNCVEWIFSENQETCLKGVVLTKNIVIGSNKLKETAIELGILHRLLNLLADENSDEQLCVEIIATICSLTKGSEAQINSIIEANTVQVLVKQLLNGKFKNNRLLIDITLRCLRSIFITPSAPVHVIYEEHNGVPLFQHLLNLIASESNWSDQECVVSVIGHSIQNTEHQNVLCSYGVIETLANLLHSPVFKVQMPVLHFLAQISYQNEPVSAVIVKTTVNGALVTDILEQMMSQEKNVLMQLASAKCLTYLYRANALPSTDSRIVYKALPTVCRICRHQSEPEFKILAAEILAYLTEIDIELQRTASVCYHIITALADYLKWPQLNNNNFSGSNIIGSKSEIDMRMFECNVLRATSLADEAAQQKNNELSLESQMKQAALKAFASLGSNDEDIRKKIIETDQLMEHVVNGLSDSSNKIRLAALRCLHSLSRSVHQLRTTFQDHPVWIPLRNLLYDSPDDVLTVASSTLCNLLLEFSPTKQHFLDRTAVELLCNLTKRDEAALRLNGVWALMNMTFQIDQSVKIQILSSLGTEQLYRLLSDNDSNIVLKTLGLIRNLLSNKPHIDHIMNLYGEQMIQSVLYILNGDYGNEVKEQALCILANIADGETAKEFLMSNEEILRKLSSIMIENNVKLQIAAIFCISNLIWNEEDGCIERQLKLKEMGFQKILQQLLTTTDTTLFDRVKTALQNFSQN